MDVGTVVVAGLSVLGTISASLIANRKSTTLLTYKIEALEKKVEKHNNLVERTYELEATAQVLAEKVHYLEKESDRIEGMDKSGRD